LSILDAIHTSVQMAHMQSYQENVSADLRKQMCLLAITLPSLEAMPK